MSEELQRPEEEEEDLDSLVQDDAIIGRAFRRSLVVILLLAAVLLVGFWLARRSPPPAPEQPIAVAAPEAVPASADPLAVHFTDVTAAAGIRFVHFNGARGDKLLPETMGGGAAFFDPDRDGDMDLLLVNSDSWPQDPQPSPPPTCAFYRNDGHGRFTDASRETGLNVRLYGMGVAVGDYDNDGWPDVFLTAVGKNRLLRNVEGRFEDVTATAGVAGDAGEWSTSASFLDYDNDGDLDLFVANYVRWSRDIDLELDYRLTGVGRAYGPPVNYQGTYPYLYRNEGDGTFKDVSAESGVQVTNSATGLPVAKALGLAPIDIDRDGWLDVLVANDTVGNFFFHNQGDGTFVEDGVAFGLAYGRSGEATGAMGADTGYFRNDDDVAFLIGNFANEMTSVYVSQGDPTIFADESIGSGVGASSRTMLTFGLFFFDYDLDGRLDLLQANGHLETEIQRVDPSQSYRQPAQLFWNAGPEARQEFVPVPPEQTGDLGRPIVGRGTAYADIDGDGDLDVLLTQVAGPPLLLRNDQQLGHHWLRLRLLTSPRPGVQRDAIGAWVDLTAGGVRQRRLLMPTRGYLTQMEPVLTFGLGTAAQVDGLRVTWPDGSVQELAQEGGGVAVDQTLVVAQPPGA